MTRDSEVRRRYEDLVKSAVAGRAAMAAQQELMRVLHERGLLGPDDVNRVETVRRTEFDRFVSLVLDGPGEGMN
ncbi:hypothetical protein GCM10017781_45750 [Deinococcus metalli]|uniref:Uncharacterized protein n=1 Tax=Deinococcus metalli TaxID=1141878 RepID=A0ABQ3JUF8_9DEIO|nr:hypothetical protein GCM10017781_45750 [Deinococcus metalli]